MEVTLDKINIIREKTGISYAEANDILSKNNGNLLEALKELEDKMSSTDIVIVNQKHQEYKEEKKKRGEDIFKKIKDLIRDGNVTKITVKNGEEIVVNIPVNAGAIGVLIAPFLSAVGLTAAFIADYTIVVTKENGETVTFEEIAESTIEKVREMFN